MSWRASTFRPVVLMAVMLAAGGCSSAQLPHGGPSPSAAPPTAALPSRSVPATKPAHLPRSAPSTSTAPSTAIPSSTSAPATKPVTLPGDDELARVALGSPHPGLPVICHGKYDLDRALGIRRTSTSFGPAAVVPVTCQGATAHSPQEIGVYVAQGDLVRRAYLVLRGDEPGGSDYLNTQRMQLAGAKLHVVQSGLAATDPFCCPTLWYAVDYTLTATGATSSKRVPIPG